MYIMRAIVIVFVIMWFLGGFVVTTGQDPASRDPYLQIRADRVVLFQLAVAAKDAAVNAYHAVRSAVEAPAPEQPEPSIKTLSGRSI